MGAKELIRTLARPGLQTPGNVLPFLPKTQTATRASMRSTPRSNALARHKLQEQRTEETRAMEKNFTRDWKVGDVYAPHDLSAAEARKWKTKKAPTTDAFDFLSLNPLDLYKNFSIMSEYVTEMGRIKPRSLTGLRPVNQRRVAKAIRRAIALGLMPSSYRHPELIKFEKKKAKQMSDIFV